MLEFIRIVTDGVTPNSTDEEGFGIRFHRCEWKSLDNKVHLFISSLNSRCSAYLRCFKPVRA